MIYRGYAERDLLQNRSSLLIYGGTEEERRAWAAEAARSFGAVGTVLRVAQSGHELVAALGEPDSVLYVPDATLAGELGQAQLVRTLREREVRPKLVVGLPGPPHALREAGRLRSDLQYTLQMAQVNLDEPGLKQVISARRASQKPPAKKKATARR